MKQILYPSSYQYWSDGTARTGSHASGNAVDLVSCRWSPVSELVNQDYLSTVLYMITRLKTGKMLFNHPFVGGNYHIHLVMDNQPARFGYEKTTYEAGKYTTSAVHVYGSRSEALSAVAEMIRAYAKRPPLRIKDMEVSYRFCKERDLNLFGMTWRDYREKKNPGLPVLIDKINAEIKNPALDMDVVAAFIAFFAFFLLSAS